VEVVGWTFLDGQKTVGQPPDGTAVIVSAAGDTIVNLKLGINFRMPVGTLYAGYGRALTGDTFYKDMLRVEYRLTW
jgi:hypothetical protein